MWGIIRLLVPGLVCFFASFLLQAQTPAYLDLLLLDAYSELPVERGVLQYELQTADGQTTGFGTSDSLGIVRLPQPRSATWTLKGRVTHLSYVPVNLSISSEQAAAPAGRTILLEPKNFLLDSVYVRASQPARMQRKDTIVYKVDSLRTLQTRKVRDVLAEVPELSVDDYGITLNGKKVKHVLIDGVDISGDNYMTLVETLHSDLIDDIEIVQDYHENPLMLDLEDDDLAINLSTRKERRIQLASSLDAGASLRQLLEADASFTVLSKQIKLVSRFNHNKLAFPLLRSPYEQGSFFEGRTSQPTNSRRSYLGSALFAPIDSRLYKYQNRSNGASLMNGNNLGRGTLRSAVYIQDARVNQQSSMESNWILPNSTFGFKSEWENALLNRELRTELVYKRPGERSFLQTELTASIPQLENEQHIRNSGLLNDTLNNHLRLGQAASADASITLTRKLRSQNLLQVYSRGSYLQMTETWTNANQRSAKLLGVGERFTDRHRPWEANALIGFSLPRKSGSKGTLTWRAESQLQQAGSSLLREIDDRRIVDWSDQTVGYSNMTLQLAGSYTQKNLLRTNDKLAGNLLVGAGRVHLELPGQSPRNYIPLEAEMSYSIPFSQYKQGIQAKVGYEFFNQAVESNQVLPLTLLTPDYNFFSGFSGDPILRGHLLSASLSDMSLHKLFNYQLNSTYRMLPRSVNRSVQQRIDHAVWSFVLTPRSEWFNTATWQYVLLWGGIRLSGNHIYIQSEVINQVNGVDLNSSFQNTQNELELTWQQRLLQVKIAYRQGFNVLRFGTDADPVFNPNSRAKIELKWITNSERIQATSSLSRLKFSEQGVPFLALDLKISFVVNNRLRLTIQGHNLLNQTAVLSETFTPLLFSRQEVAVNGRFVGLFASFDF